MVESVVDCYNCVVVQLVVGSNVASVPSTKSTG
jgi:hypothetical protein